MSNKVERFTNVSTEDFYYSEQFKKYIVQFMAVFSGLHVSMGKNDYKSETDLARVPIKYASMDRVVAHVLTDHTDNKMLRLPMMAAHIQSIDLAPDRRKGVDQVSREVKLPRGGVLPDDLVNITKVMPIPYNVLMNLSLYASNTDQHLQMLEQILVMFDPTLQLQTSDDFSDWTKLAEIELFDISLQEQIPSGTDKRIITSEITFKVPVWISPPANLKTNIINSIRLRLDLVNQADSVEQAARDVTGDSEIDELIVDINQLNIPTN